MIDMFEPLPLWYMPFWIQVTNEKPTKPAPVGMHFYIPTHSGYLQTREQMQHFLYHLYDEHASYSQPFSISSLIQDVMTDVASVSEGDIDDAAGFGYSVIHRSRWGQCWMHGDQVTPENGTYPHVTIPLTYIVMKALLATARVIIAFLKNPQQTLPGIQSNEQIRLGTYIYQHLAQVRRRNPNLGNYPHLESVDVSTPDDYVKVDLLFTRFPGPEPLRVELTMHRDGPIRWNVKTWVGDIEQGKLSLLYQLLRSATYIYPQILGLNRDYFSADFILAEQVTLGFLP